MDTLLIKIFATNSIRDGGAQTMTDEQIQAACSEAAKLGKRTLVHAQGPEGARAAALCGRGGHRGARNIRVVVGDGRA